MIEQIENIEQLSDTQDLEARQRLTPSEQSYIEEVLPYRDLDIIATRIDELGGQQPPKALDSNREISEMIEPIKEGINPIYLEAPSDSIQIEQASDVMKDMEGLRFEEWKELSFDQRVELLQKLEYAMAQIEHRPPCELNVEKLDEGDFGYFSKSSLDITLNSRYIKSDSFADYKECLDTIIHEGRHAYQHYNLTVREVHSREGDLTNWKWNEFELGYRNPRIHGMKAYWSQPVECDARAYAEDVLKKFLEKTES